MILFYSDYCKHCRMLLDTIERLQSKNIRLVSLDTLRANHRTIPSQIHSVPALMILPSKQLLFGKQVFDYLLLPGKGVLTMGVTKQASENGSRGSLSQMDQPMDPEAFSLIISNGSGDNFSFIEDERMDNNRSYVWTSIEDMETSTSSSTPSLHQNHHEEMTPTMQASTRVKKEMLDIEEFKAKRAEDLHIMINTTITEPPATTY